jgi:transposase InsO family protein
VPWQESSPMSERLAFIQACLDRRDTVVSICDRFGISEKTGHKLLKRFREEGWDSLGDRSRARLTHPYRIAPEVSLEIVRIRRKHPTYGPAMIRNILLLRDAERHWPAASSIGELLKRANLIRSKRRRPHTKERAALDSGRAAALAPNTVWTADFKGEFRLNGGSGPYCYPLTVMDLHSRYLLGCTALRTTAIPGTRRTFVRLFREYGLPGVIRTDNGVPFAQPNALGRLGQLALWWVRLGIKPEHNKPATPSENAEHERFHKTLKADATKPASSSMESQQRRFNDFKTEYNEHRPHTSVPNNMPPGSLYVPSVREYPERLQPLEYPDESDVRLATAGYMRWKGERFFLSSNLSGEYIGAAEAENDLVTISFGLLELGQYDPITKRFIPRARWTGNV